jgi:lipopolysaccharide transport system permease protein
LGGRTSLVFSRLRSGRLASIYPRNGPTVRRGRLRLDDVKTDPCVILSTVAARLRRSSHPSSGAGRFRARHSAEYLVSHYKLLLAITFAELRRRYAGSVLGVGWAVLTPLLILSVYATIYLWIFPFDPPGLSSTEYVLYILCGLAPFLTLAEALSLGVGSVIVNRSVLSNVIFPIDLVPAKAVISAQGPLTVGMVILLIGTVAIGRLTWTAALVPLLWLMNVAALTGVVWIISLLSVVLRDLQFLITAILMLLLIASPFAYTPEMVPQSLKWVIFLNPFAYFVIAYQKLWILGELPTLFELTALVVLSVGGMFIGGWFFARTKPVLIDYV